MRPRSVQNESKSLKTFFIYTGIVVFFILLSLSIRAFYLIQQSKFDGKQQFVIALGQEGIVEKIIAFTPAERSVTTLELKGEDVRFSSLGRQLSILPNATIETNGNVSTDEDISQTMQSVLLNYYTVKTNLTIFDAFKLFFISRKPTLTDREVREISVLENEEENNKKVANLITDDTIFSENVSIQIINASGVSGMGRRLERALINRGGNVVSVTTSRDLASASTIQHYGEETYTLITIKKLLGFPVKTMEQEGIAEIIITIGEDSKNSESF